MNGVMSATWILGLVALCSVAVAYPRPSREPAGVADPALEIDLTVAAWTKNAQVVEDVVVVGDDDEAAVVLSFDALGTRWSTTFSTAQPSTWRLALDWALGPKGLLIEIMIDGEPLPPLRDVWRPTARSQRANLGPRWLGQGEHLLEFIAREAVDDGALPVRRLTLQRP